MTDEEYKKTLKQFHKLSDRHVLVIETDMPYSMEQGEPEHGVTWETVSVDFYDTHLFASDLDAYWTFRIRDSY
jgi:hypothetical protein